MTTHKNHINIYWIKTLKKSLNRGKRALPVENKYATHHKQKRNDTVPMTTRSQTKKTISDGVAPALGWERESHIPSAIRLLEKNPSKIKKN